MHQEHLSEGTSEQPPREPAGGVVPPQRGERHPMAAIMGSADLEPGARSVFWVSHVGAGAQRLGHLLLLSLAIAESRIGN